MIEIEKYNNNLVNPKTIINIIDYVKNVNKLKYNIDIETYNEKYEAEKDDNAQKICPLCRL